MLTQILSSNISNAASRYVPAIGTEWYETNKEVLKTIYNIGFSSYQDSRTGLFGFEGAANNIGDAGLKTFVELSSEIKGWASLHFLDPSGRNRFNFSSIAPLGKLKNIEHFSYIGSGGLDLTFLRNYRKIKYIYISKSDEDSFTFLSDLPRLKKLWFNEIKVLDIRDLLPNPQLTALSIIDTPVSNFDAIADFKKISELALKNIGVKSLTPIGRLNSLKSLKLREMQPPVKKDIKVDNPIKDSDLILEEKTEKFSGFNGDFNLKEIVLSGVRFSDYSWLKNQRDLNKVSLSSYFRSKTNFQVEDLAQYENLKVLYLNGVHAENLTSLGQLKLLNDLTLRDFPEDIVTSTPKLDGLKSLETYGVDFTSLKFLENFPVLEKIKIGGMRKLLPQDFPTMDRLLSVDISHLSGENLGNLTKNILVQDLDLSSSKFSSYSGIHNFKNLRTLDLSNSTLTSLCKLGKLPNLINLDLSGTKITTLDCIDQFPNLQELNLVLTKVKDLSTLKFLAKLKILKVHLTEVENLEIISQLSSLTELTTPKINVSHKVLKASSLIEKHASESTRARTFYRPPN